MLRDRLQAYENHLVAQTMQTGMRSVALKMLKDHFDKKVISKMTSVSETELERIKEESV